MMHLRRVVFPIPLRPMRQVRRTGSHLEIDVPEGMTATVTTG